MRIAVSGGDERYDYLVALIEEMGEQAVRVTCADDVRDADGLVSAYPFTEAVAQGLKGMRPGARLWLLAPGEIGDLPGFRVKNLLDDALFVNENATLTAEGALYLAMSRAKFSLCASRVMVIGYGRIGRALTEFLVGLRCVVTVVSRRDQGRLQAMARGAYAATPERMPGELADQRIVFVTSPERVLGDEQLAYASRRTLFFDLSSAPYGVDASAARTRGLSLFAESGVPGRVYPESAAKAMARALSRDLGGRDLS